MKCKFKLIVGGLFLLASGVLVAQVSDLPVQKIESDRATPGYFDKQGYSQEESEAKLDPAIRHLLDVVLRLYYERGLFLDRKKALEVVGATVYERDWDQAKSFPEKKRMGFRENFAKEGIFARPGWEGFYDFGGQPTAASKKWYAQIDIKVDSIDVCVNSRAVEGYLDLVLDSNLFDILPGHAPRGRIFRHDVLHATPWARALYDDSPSLLLTFESGCLVNLVVAGEFTIGVIDDEKSYY